jgi:hypothetical protein
MAKRRIWKTIKPEKPPRLLLSPAHRKALGWAPDPDWYPSLDQSLEKCRARHGSGDPYAALDAIEFLAMTYFPDWLREFYVERWHAYRSHRAGTLDKAFGIKRRKQLKGAAAREQLREQIVFRVYDLHREGKPIDNQMFAAVGAEVGRSGATVAKIFGEPKSDELRELLRRVPFRANTKTP